MVMMLRVLLEQLGDRLKAGLKTGGKELISFVDKTRCQLVVVPAMPAP
jgi:hypothetical protein